MSRFYFVILLALISPVSFAANLVIDDFEGYLDDFELHETWTFTKAGGPDGLFVYLDTAKTPPQGTTCLLMDVNMPEKWWYNTVRKTIGTGPIDLAQYGALTFWFHGDETVNPANITFVAFLFDSQGRALRFAIPADYLNAAAWQKITLNLGSFSQEEWDTGYGTDTPDANPADIVSVGLMVVGNEIDQIATFYVDDVQMTELPQNILVDDFENYADDFELQETWTFTKAGGPDGLFVYIDKTKTPPQGSSCLLMDINMPEKWWYNTVRKSLVDGAIDISKFVSLDFWFHGDPTVNPADIAFVAFLFDSQGRALRFAIPADYLNVGAWQKITLNLASFSQEEWDTGYGTDTPDANPQDITTVGLMVVGNEVNQIATFYVDDIQFASKGATASVSGTITENGAPLAGVTVYAIEQGAIHTATTGADGQYTFPDLSQGKQYRFVPVFTAYDFTPGMVFLTLLETAYTRDFTGAPSLYNRLETTAIQDQFDESGLNPAIVYRGARDWGHAEAGNVRPIIDVTQDKTYPVSFPDAAGGEAVLYGIPENPLPGATSPRFALEVGSSYSWDMLAFGQNTDRNYYVEVDAYCDVRWDLNPGSFDRVSVGIHCSFADPGKIALDAYSDTNLNRSSGGYALSYESDTGDITARKYAPANDKAHVLKRLEGYAVEYGKVTLNESGWHRLRVEFLNDTITFKVDGQTIATATDTEYPFGPAGLHYRACFTDALSDLVMMNHARFDNLKAGPTGPVGVDDWMLN
ncbi:MAG TPA: carboxypeptidase-like regulatory domain-containing protein [bacterium]|nr:carboxypeptidase-like regulatory domain-containing protein [bacterium]HOL93729.1 carboxypeptidase-like regulatory domain-containing protein [bacterium]HPP01250.1 carboxypeptidase-like regulatory domain-containing protein [bacterium]